jgi:hypothetical protein
MAEMSYRIVDRIEDDDPTEELQILPGRMLETDEDTSVTETISATEAISAAKQSFEDEHLDAELRDANDKISELSSELCSRTETMQSIQRELDRLQDFSDFLEKEVRSGKKVISNVTDELISVRTEQNDASEQLRRRDKQIAVLRDKVAKKDAFIEEFARQVDTASSSDGRDHLDSQQVNGNSQAEHADGRGHDLRQNGHAQLNRLRMLVARHDDKAMRYPILPGGMSLGTSTDNDVLLKDAFVSYRHARITETAAGCVLKDLGSSNGTWVNQKRVKWQVLSDGDLIDIGPLRFEFVDKSVEIKDEQIEDGAE